MITKHLLQELQLFVDSHINIVSYNLEAPIYIEKRTSEIVIPYDIESYINQNRKLTFNEILFQFIDKKELSDTKVYKKAGIDRRHFSKIRSNSDYHPGKKTVITLALTLELDKEETDDLLSSAGYSLSDCDTFDLVIQFCLEKKIYDINDVNMALDYFSLKPIGGVLE